MLGGFFSLEAPLNRGPAQPSETLNRSATYLTTQPAGRQSVTNSVLHPYGSSSTSGGRTRSARVSGLHWRELTTNKLGKAGRQDGPQAQKPKRTTHVRLHETAGINKSSRRCFRILPFFMDFRGLLQKEQNLKNIGGSYNHVKRNHLFVVSFSHILTGYDQKPETFLVAPIFRPDMH